MSTRESDSLSYKYGWVSETGQVLIKPEWQMTGEFGDKDYTWVAYDQIAGIVDNEGNLVFRTDGMIRDFDRNGLAPCWMWGEQFEFRGWLDHTGEVKVAVPEGEGWEREDPGWSGHYNVARQGRLEGFSKWWARFKGWLGQEKETEDVKQFRTYDKDGKLIWSSTWMRKTTSAWLWFGLALVPLLVSMWVGRRGTVRA